MPSMFIHCDNRAVIAVANNKTYSCKSRHIRLRDGIISIDYVTSKVNLPDPHTKPLGRNLISGTSRGTGLKPI